MEFSVEGRRVLVVGAARSGVAVAGLLARRGGRVTVTDVKPVEDDLMAVFLKVKSTGIAVYERPLEQATLTYPGEQPTPLDPEARADCSNGFDGILRIDVDRSRSGCLLFPRSGDAMPERFQLALEVVPADAGGIWNLR